ncbi:unnamed protein product, partial [Closterium sp. NIES-53]
CFAAALPHLVSTLLAPEGDPDAPDIPTPRFYAEAIEGPYSSQWQAAMDEEMASWKSTSTYVDEVPPPGANIVSGMWIFRVKRPPGSPPVFKVRYVARGFSQRQGVDYFQNFSPTPKMTTLWVLLHVAAQCDYELHSLEFSTAFLQGSLHEEIWLRRPPGFTGSFPPGTQWSLQRLVYGLRQAPRELHDTLRTTLAALGFAPSTADPLLFLRTDTSLPPFYILVYVDDLVFATADTAELAHVKSELQNRHTCTDLGELRSYLGLQITRDRARHTITLTQSHMVQQVLQRFDFTYSSPQATPLSTRHSLSALPLNESVEPSGQYPELVGCLMYLMTCTRPDLAYPMSILARCVAHGRHRPEHMAAAKRVLRYLCSTSGLGLVLGGGVQWSSLVTQTRLGSSCEVEIYTGAMSAQELRWLTYLLTDRGEPPRSPPVLYVDNKAMLALCREHRLEHRTKHIALRYFLARELQQRGQLRLAYVTSQANTADIFTKALQPCDHQRFCTLLACFALLCLTGLVTPSSPPLCLWGSFIPHFLTAESGGPKTEGVEPGGAEPESVEPGGPADAPPRLSPHPEPLSPQQLRKWFAQRIRLRSGAARAGVSAAGDIRAGGAGVTAGAGGTGGAATTGPGGVRTGGTGAAGTGGVGETGAGDPTQLGAARAGGARAVGARVGGTGAGGAGAGGARAVDPRAGGVGGTVRRRQYFVPLLQQVFGVASSPDQTQPPLQPASPLPAPSPFTEQTSSLIERCEPASRPTSPVRTGRCVPHPRPPPVPGTHAMALHPSSVPLRVPLPPPPESSQPALRFSGQRQGVDYFHTFSPTPKMTTLQVLLHVAAQRDYDLRQPLYGLRQAPCEWHDTLRTTLVALGFAPSTADPSLFLCTDTSLPPFYVLVYIDDLVFATADTEALNLVKSEL